MRLTLREALDLVGIDDDPLGCAFVIAAFLRSAVQGEPSTYEGECASLRKAAELGFRVNTPEGVRVWLADLSAVADLPMPAKWWQSIMGADGCE